MDRSQLPTRAELYRGFPQSLDHIYNAEQAFEMVAFRLVKFGYLDSDTLTVVGAISRPLRELHRVAPRMGKLDLSPLFQPRPDYAEQTQIDPRRVEMMDELAWHYDLDFGLCLRALGGEYLAVHRKAYADALFLLLEDLISTDDLSHIKRIFRGEVPARFNWLEPDANRREFLALPPHPSLTKYREVMLKAVNKEERHCHIMPFSKWMVWCSNSAHHVPQMIIYKDGKGRVIWDGTTIKHAEMLSMNRAYDAMQHEAEITFGQTLPKFCQYLWNARISHPDEDILLAFVDISSCFRFPRIHPDLVGAFGFVFDEYFMASNAHVFGHVSSATSWEPFRRAIEALAVKNFGDLTLVEKHKDLIDAIVFAPPLPRAASPAFAQARPCRLNGGVLDSDGGQLPIPTFVYVDDSLMAATRPNIRLVLAATIEAIFQVCGQPDVSRRPSAVNIDKLRALLISHLLILLGFEFDTRRMTVAIPQKYRSELIKMLVTTYHSNRRRFNIEELATLTGKLGRVAQMYRPLYHVMGQLYASMASALAGNGKYLLGSCTKYRDLIKTIKKRDREQDSSLSTRRVHFAMSQAAKRRHGCKKLYRMPPSFFEELDFIRNVITDEGLRLESNIGHLVERDFDWDIAGDSCKSSGGGWSTDLGLWWYLAYPADIVARARLPSAAHKGYICINCLETVVVVVNFAAVIYTCHFDGIDITTIVPVLLNWCDNTSACSWINKRCKTSAIGRALGRLFMGMLMGTTIGIHAEWLSTTANKLADEISRLKKEAIDYDFSRLLLDYPQLQQCRRFQPSESLLKLIYATLRGEWSPNPMELRSLKPTDLGKFIT